MLEVLITDSLSSKRIFKEGSDVVPGANFHEKCEIRAKEAAKIIRKYKLPKDTEQKAFFSAIEEWKLSKKTPIKLDEFVQNMKKSIINSTNSKVKYENFKEDDADCLVWNSGIIWGLLTIVIDESSPARLFIYNSQTEELEDSSEEKIK